MHRKLRVRLEPKTPLFLVSTIQEQLVVPSVELVSFSADTDRVEWCVKLQDGSLIEGRHRGERALRCFDDKTWIALSIPNINHMTSKGIAPDFVLFIPGHVIIASDPKGLRPVRGS